MNMNIDENLYSRQLYVLGHEAMYKMQNSNILILGMGGLGAEIAKNIVLAGVKSVTIFDKQNVSYDDLSSQFFLSEQDICKNRAECASIKLAELNSYVPVSVYNGEVSEEFMMTFQVIVLTESSSQNEQRIGKFCHENKIKFISSNTKGVFGKIFCDFGDPFVIFDADGQASKCSLISFISNESNGIVTVLDEHRHDLEDGAFVTFQEVKGMSELNGKEFQIKVLGPYSFSIGCDTTNFGKYELSGIVNEIKKQKIINFKSIEEARKHPEYLISDYTKMADNDSIHIAFESLSMFSSYNSGRLPEEWNDVDAESFVKICKNINSNYEKPFENLNESLLKIFSYTCSGNLCPMASVIGGIAAQEVIKACTGKFHPIVQYFYFDCREVLPDQKIKIEKNLNSRYSSQIRVFGKEFQEKLERTNCFLVGSGALGCEYIKNFAMMGLCCSGNGKLTITDMDTIEKSNLNRQFLFRSWDVQKFKSQVASHAAKSMNSNIKITANTSRVGPETEKIYNHEFFNSLDFICNALDNIAARLYIDSKCIEYGVPLIESGTLGTSGNVLVVLPHVTEAYSSSQDPPEKQIPICTLHNFPNSIEHTLQWARDQFEGLFSNLPKSALKYIKEPTNFLRNLAKLNSQQRLEELKQLKKIMIIEKCQDFNDCIAWARRNWQENFHNIIIQLLYNFPPNQKNKNGLLFWSGVKRCPHALDFDSNNQTHLDFIYSSSNLKAFMHGIEQVRDRIKVKEIVDKIQIEKFHPKIGVKIKENEDDDEGDSNVIGDEDENLIEELTKLFEQNYEELIKNVDLNPIDFEKDDDSNLHMDFITSCSNLRAQNYDISPTDKHNSKLIAGKIIPAIATTTSVAVGLDCIELYKLVQGHRKIDSFRNYYFNLANNIFTSSEPIPVKRGKYNDQEWSLWDRILVKGDITIREFIEHFRESHKLKVSMIGTGVITIYAGFLSIEKKNERLEKKIIQVLEEIKKEPIPSDKRFLTLSVSCYDLNDEDVEIPLVKYEF